MHSRIIFWHSRQGGRGLVGRSTSITAPITHNSRHPSGNSQQTLRGLHSRNRRFRREVNCEGASLQGRSVGTITSISKKRYHRGNPRFLPPSTPAPALSAGHNPYDDNENYNVQDLAEDIERYSSQSFSQVLPEEIFYRQDEPSIGFNGIDDDNLLGQELGDQTFGLFHP